MIYDFLCKSSEGKNFQGENQSKKRKGKEFSFFCGFQTFNDVRFPFFYVGRNACFNKVFKLTVTNNFQSCLCFGGEKSALKLKAYFFVPAAGEKAVIDGCKSRRYNYIQRRKC